MEKDIVKEEELRFTYKEVIAMTLAAYRIILPKIATVALSIIIVVILLKVFIA